MSSTASKALLKEQCHEKSGPPSVFTFLPFILRTFREVFRSVVDHNILLDLGPDPKLFFSNPEESLVSVSVSVFNNNNEVGQAFLL